MARRSRVGRAENMEFMRFVPVVMESRTMNRQEWNQIWTLANVNVCDESNYGLVCWREYFLCSLWIIWKYSKPRALPLHCTRTKLPIYQLFHCVLVQCLPTGYWNPPCSARRLVKEMKSYQQSSEDTLYHGYFVLVWWHLMTRVI